MSKTQDSVIDNFHKIYYGDSSPDAYEEETHVNIKSVGDWVNLFSVIVLTTFNDTRYFSIPFTLITLGSFILGLLLLLMSVVLFSIKKSSKI